MGVVQPVAPGTVVGNVQVVPPLLRLKVCAAIGLDPAAMLARFSHKCTLAFLILAYSQPMYSQINNRPVALTTQVFG